MCAWETERETERGREREEREEPFLEFRHSWGFVRQKIGINRVLRLNYYFGIHHDFLGFFLNCFDFSPIPFEISLLLPIRVKTAKIAVQMPAKIKKRHGSNSKIYSEACRHMALWHKITRSSINIQLMVALNSDDLEKYEARTNRAWKVAEWKRLQRICRKIEEHGLENIAEMASRHSITFRETHLHCQNMKIISNM